MAETRYKSWFRKVSATIYHFPTSFKRLRKVLNETHRNLKEYSKLKGGRGGRGAHISSCY